MVKVRRITALVLALITVFSFSVLSSKAYDEDNGAHLIIDANGGTGSVNRASYNCRDGLMSHIFQPTYKKGYICLGFSEDPKATEPEYNLYDIYKFKVPGTYTVYAVYKKIQDGDIYKTVNLKYGEKYMIKFDDFTPVRYTADCTQVVRADYKSGEIKTLAGGTGYVYAFDADGNQRVVQFNVKYTFPQKVRNFIMNFDYFFSFGVFLPVIFFLSQFFK